MCRDLCIYMCTSCSEVRVLEPWCVVRCVADWLHQYSAVALYKKCVGGGKEGLLVGFGQLSPSSEQNGAMGWNKAAQQGTA